MRASGLKWNLVRGQSSPSVCPHIHHQALACGSAARQQLAIALQGSLRAGPLLNLNPTSLRHLGDELRPGLGEYGCVVRLRPNPLAVARCVFSLEPARRIASAAIQANHVLLLNHLYGYPLILADLEDAASIP